MRCSTPYEDFAVRRRIPRVLAVCRSQRAADSLLLGLEDIRFEVRFQCGRALAAIVAKQPDVRVDAADVFDVVQKEVAVGRPVWEGRRLLDRLDDGEPATFVDDFIRSRASQSLAHVFTMLSLVLPAEPLQIALRGLHADDQNLRGTALEYLESVLPPTIREPLWPFLEDRRPAGRTVRPRDGHSGRLGAFESLDHAEPRGAQAARVNAPQSGRPMKHIMLKQGCRIAAREPTPAPGRVADDRFHEALAAGSCQRSARTARAVQPDRDGAVDGLSADGPARHSDRCRPSFEIAGVEGPRHRGGRRHRVGRDVRVRALRATHARDEDEHQPRLHAAQCRSHRGDEHMGRAAAHCRGMIVSVSWIAILLLMYSMVAAGESRQDAGGGARGGVVRSASASGLPICAACRLRRLFETLLIFWPNYACAGLATIPSRFLRHVGQKLSKARELGSYELVKLLGHGGMGEVWEAKHRLLARRAAVKLVRPELLGAGSDAEARLVLKRFEREAQATAALSSPHTIQVFDFGITDDGMFYLRHGAADGPRSRIAGARVRTVPRRGPATCCGRSAIHSPTRTRAAWFTATSSPRISTSAGWGSNTTS